MPRKLWCSPMAKEKLKILQAGNLWYAIQYTSLRGGVSKENRRMKAEISSRVREALNFRASYQKLWLILEATFDKERDLFVSFTYRDDTRPVRKEDADRKFKYFLRALREHRRELGFDTVDVWTTEGYHSDGKLHHHLFINGTGQDYDIILKLWKKYGDQVEILPYGCKSSLEHAKYITKEPREKGRRHVGDRTWRASKNVKRPVPVYEDVTAGTTLTAPPGAFVVSSDRKDNVYGRYQYIEARLDPRKLNTKNRT